MNSTLEVEFAGEDRQSDSSGSWMGGGGDIEGVLGGVRGVGFSWRWWRWTWRRRRFVYRGRRWISINWFGWFGCSEWVC